jgi:phosphotransferase system enzyme I (PtsI)
MARAEKIHPDYAVEKEKQTICRKLAAVNDPYMRERAADIGNVCDALIRRMHGLIDEGLAVAGEGRFVIVA